MSTITLELKKKDYEKLLSIIESLDDKLHKKILIARDDDFKPNSKKQKVEYYEYHDDGIDEELEVSVDEDGFFSLK